MQELNHSILRFLVENTPLDNGHLERFNIVCTPFPMERHIFQVMIASHSTSVDCKRYAGYGFCKQ